MITTVLNLDITTLAVSELTDLIIDGIDIGAVETISVIYDYLMWVRFPKSLPVFNPVY